MRLPEPGSRELLRPLRRAARQGGGRARDDADVHTRRGARTLLEALEDLGITGPALVVRSGGGRAGETFHPEGETTIGRSPDCGIFLDDVTVSRKHAVIVQRDGGFFVEDQGSLNGTFVNRKRVESAQLEDGDELQIGKYRLTFLQPLMADRPRDRVC